MIFHFPFIYIYGNHLAMINFPHVAVIKYSFLNKLINNFQKPVQKRNIKDNIGSTEMQQNKKAKNILYPLRPYPHERILDTLYKTKVSFCLLSRKVFALSAVPFISFRPSSWVLVCQPLPPQLLDSVIFSTALSICQQPG